MYNHADQGHGSTGATATLSLKDALPPLGVRQPLFDRFGGRFADIDLVPDLGQRIGSRDWWRGLATLLALCTAAIMLSPGLDQTLPGPVPAPLDDSAWESARAQTIAPLAWGADTGHRMAATDLVRPLADTPERPTLELTATLGTGDGFARVLERAGVGSNDASDVAKLVSAATPLGDIRPGTRLDIRLGRRPNKRVARPLDALAFRARFDLRLELARVDGALRLTRVPIAVDNTPLRVQGVVGDSLYRAARAAGAPARAVETYLRALATKLSVGDIRSDAKFDIIVAQRRAETGEVEIGELLYAGLDQGRRQVRLLKWQLDGRTEWFEASGVGERRGGLVRPVAGHQTSGFGMRFHPLLGYNRFHRGIDFGAGYGSPIYAVTDGVVSFAGRAGGHGNHVRLNHAGNLVTGYSHMSRIAVRGGQQVRRGQVIGYVGSTGLSTGPHLHFEVYKGGVPINPKSVSFVTTAQLSGEQLRAFRAKLATLLSTPIGGGAPIRTAAASAQ